MMLIAPFGWSTDTLERVQRIPMVNPCELIPETESMRFWTSRFATNCNLLVLV